MIPGEVTTDRFAGLVGKFVVLTRGVRDEDGLPDADRIVVEGTVVCVADTPSGVSLIFDDGTGMVLETDRDYKCWTDWALQVWESKRARAQMQARRK